MSVMQRLRITMMVTVFGMVILGCIGGAALAQGTAAEGLRGVAAWEGQGMLFQLEEEQLYLVGAFVGIMVGGNDKEQLNAATMTCPATIETNLATMYQTGHGRCILIDKDDNKVFAKWACTGTPKNCKGNFTFTGGTGKFKGISGINEFFVQTDVMGFQSTGVPGVLKKAAAGRAVWPEITYELPSR